MNEIYLYWRSEEARKEEIDPRTRYIRRQEEDERNYDPCRYHDIDCRCKDCTWEEEAEFRRFPYKSDDELEREAELRRGDGYRCNEYQPRGVWHDYRSAAAWVNQRFEEEVWQTQMRRAKECEQQLAERTANLAAARDQLAEMRQIIGRFHDTLSIYAGGFQMRDADHVPKLLEDADRILSAAPAGGVLWRGEADAWEIAGGYSLALDWVNWMHKSYIPNGGLVQSMKKRRRVIVTITEAPCSDSSASGSRESG